MSVQMDILCRLQVLEGFLGVPEGTYTQPRSRLGAAVKALESPIHPSWLAESDVGFYMGLKATLDKHLRKRPAYPLVEDLLQDILCDNTLYKTGVLYRNLIAAGHSPQRLHSNRIIRLLYRKVLDAHLRYKPVERFNFHDHDLAVEAFDPTLSEILPALLTLKDKQEEILALADQRYIRLQLETYFKTGVWLKHIEIAKHFGVTAPAVNRPLLASWERLWKQLALWVE